MATPCRGKVPGSEGCSGHSASDDALQKGGSFKAGDSPRSHHVAVTARLRVLSRDQAASQGGGLNVPVPLTLNVGTGDSASHTGPGQCHTPAGQRKSAVQSPGRAGWSGPQRPFAQAPRPGAE